MCNTKYEVLRSSYQQILIPIKYYEVYLHAVNDTIYIYMCVSYTSYVCVSIPCSVQELLSLSFVLYGSATTTTLTFCWCAVLCCEEGLLWYIHEVTAATSVKLLLQLYQENTYRYTGTPAVCNNIQECLYSSWFTKAFIYYTYTIYSSLFYISYVHLYVQST